MGKVWVALTNKTILIINEIRKPAYHQYISFPLVSLAFPKQEAKATSNNPAIINSIQFIFSSFCMLQRYCFVTINGINARFVEYRQPACSWRQSSIGTTYFVATDFSPLKFRIDFYVSRRLTYTSAKSGTFAEWGSSFKKTICHRLKRFTKINPW